MNTHARRFTLLLAVAAATVLTSCSTPSSEGRRSQHPQHPFLGRPVPTILPVRVTPAKANTVARDTSLATPTPLLLARRDHPDRLPVLPDPAPAPGC